MANLPTGSLANRLADIMLREIFQSGVTASALAVRAAILDWAAFPTKVPTSSTDAATRESYLLGGDSSLRLES